MSEKKVKETVLRWFIPFFILLAFMTGMLIKFLVVTYQTETVEVEAELTQIVEGYAGQLQMNIQSLANAGRTMGKAINYCAYNEKEEALTLLNALGTSTDAYMTVLCRKTGSGAVQYQDGRQAVKVDLREKDYFQKIVESGGAYTFTGDNGITGEGAIICTTPIVHNEQLSGYILQYYDLAHFRRMIKKVEFDMEAVYLLINKNGDIITTAGNVTGSFYAEESNLWEAIEAKADKGADIVERILGRMDNGIRGMEEIRIENREQVLIFVPTGIADWFMAVNLNQSYVDRQIGKQWQPMKSMVWQMLFMILIFLGVILIINIISKLRANEKNKKLEDKADTDLLTELNNKLATERKIKQYIKEHPDEQAMMFLLDIDNFKKINDTMGHAFGDEVLRTLGQQIKAEFRASDIIGRTGGDEFIIFLRNIKEEAIINNEAKRVARFFKNFQAGQYVKYSATASIGAAIYPRDARDFEGLYRAADQALYTAKKRGKNQLAFYRDVK